MDFYSGFKTTIIYREGEAPAEPRASARAELRNEKWRHIRKTTQAKASGSSGLFFIPQTNSNEALVVVLRFS